MTTTSNLLRAVVVYALVLPLALVLGYLLATPAEFSSVATVGLVLLVLSAPLLLKWHSPVLFLSWNMSVVVFFLPGAPDLWVVMAFASLLICIIQRTLIQNMRFIYAPSVALPILFLLTVVLVTAQLTTGFGLRILGSETFGAKNYLYIAAGAAGFLAMMAHRIPLRKSALYVGLFYLSGVANLIASLAPFVPPAIYPLFLLFPVTGGDLGGLGSAGFNEGITRFYGSSVAAGSAFSYLLARYGLRNLLEKGDLLRLGMLAGTVVVGIMGGFRSMFLFFALVLAIQFYLEGLFRSNPGRLLILGAFTALVVVVPFVNRLPLSIQRSISFLPINVDQAARLNAEESSEWRVQMWKIVLPDVPKYFWLGKGVGVSGLDLQLTSDLVHQGFRSSQEEALLAGNYHNGPLSLLITFGVWGAIGWLWFVGASLRALYLNYRYGEDSLKTINTFLLACFATKVIMFFFVFGDLRVDFAPFVGMIGFGLSLNHGIHKPVRLRTALSIPIKVREPAKLAPAPSR